MTTLADLLTSDLDLFFNTNEFAVGAVFTPAGGLSRTIPVLFDKEYAAIQGVASYQVTITCKSTDVVGAARGDTFAIAGTTWYMKDVAIDVGDGLTVIELTRG